MSAMSPKLVILAAALITAGPVLAATGGSSGGGSSTGGSSSSSAGGHGGGGSGGASGGGGGGSGGHSGGGGLGGRAAAASAHGAAFASRGFSHLGSARVMQSLAGKHEGVEHATTRASNSKTPGTSYHRRFCREPQSDISASPLVTIGCTQFDAAGGPNYWMPCHGGPRKNRT